jgi:hypothetical protein
MKQTRRNATFAKKAKITVIGTQTVATPFDRPLFFSLLV